MNTLVNRKNMATFSIALAICIVAILLAPDPQPGTETNPWYSIVPPLLAVSLAIVSGRIVTSLFVSVAIGGLLTSVPQAPMSILAWPKGLYAGFTFILTSVTDPLDLKLLAFVILVLSMISVVVVAGGLHGVVQRLGQFVKGPRSAQVVTTIMGLLIFIDDYANTMIVGTAMRPVTDKMRVSREKLAFIVDSTSAPVAGLAIVSTWVGYEVGLFTEAAEHLGIQSNGYAMLFDALIFRFYCILMIVFVFANAISGKDFGPMRSAEKRAQNDGLVAAEDAVPMTSKAFSTAEPHEKARIHSITAILPVGALFIFLLGGIWYDGGGLDRLSENAMGLFSFSIWREVMIASENSVDILAYGAGFALIVAAICAVLIARCDAPIIARAAASGAKSSLLPITILVLAWSLKASCDSLGTGEFLVAVVGDKLAPAWFPAIIFVVAGFTSFATGTSYGTMAILMPTAIPIAYHLEGGNYGLITMITLASVLDGSIVGDHCSPISDTTIMSSIASSTDHLHHVRTQFPYSVTVAAMALIFGYIPAGLGVSPLIGLGGAIACIIALFTFIPGQLATE